MNLNFSERELLFNVFGINIKTIHKDGYDVEYILKYNNKEVKQFIPTEICRKMVDIAKDYDSLPIIAGTIGKKLNNGLHEGYLISPKFSGKDTFFKGYVLND